MICALLASFSSLSPLLIAQESPAAAAERQEAEERYKRLSADIEDLKATNQSYLHRLNEQRDEIRKLNDELVRATANKDFATREDLKHLAEKIREVDEKRIADDARVMAEMGRLAKLLASPLKTTSGVSPPKAISEQGPGAAPGRINTSTNKPTADQKSGNEKGFEYIVRMDDNPRVIAKALAAQGMKVTQKQIIEANPTVNWTKLHIGQKLFIPAPPP